MNCFFLHRTIKEDGGRYSVTSFLTIIVTVVSLSLSFFHLKIETFFSWHKNIDKNKKERN
jgi:hypothetical protein